MATTFILLCITIILLILVILGIMKILPSCDDDSSQTADYSEAGWVWDPLFGKPTEFIKGIQDTLKTVTLGIVDINPPWWFKKLTSRKGFACWPSNDAPFYYNIQFLGFMQFAVWMVLGNTIPGSFNAFPMMTVPASLVIFLRWLWLSDPWWGILPGLRSGSGLCFVTQGLIALLPFVPVLKRFYDKYAKSTMNCGEILKLGAEMELSPTQVSEAYGYKDYKKSPFNDCKTEDPKSAPILPAAELAQAIQNIEHGKPGHVGGSAGKNKLEGWNQHIAKSTLDDHPDSKNNVDVADFMILLKEFEWESIADIWMDFYIPVPFTDGLIRAGISDIIFIIIFFTICATAIVTDIIKWSSHLPAEPYLPAVPKPISMFWNAIPVYYTIGGYNESCSNLFYLIYLFRMTLLIITLVFLLLYIFYDLLVLLSTMIWELLFLFIVLIIFVLLWSQVSWIFSWLWNNFLKYIFYVGPKWLITHFFSSIGWVFGGFFGEIGQILKLFTNTIF
jgi:hypothetical protein